MVRDPGVLMMIILVIVEVAMIFWRTVLKLAVASIVTLTVLGLLQLLQSLH
jgi:hypothetical protein